MPALIGCGSGAVRTEVSRTAYLMGTTATLTVGAESRTAGLETLERMVRMIGDTEAQISTWRATSELSALNRQPVNTPMPVSDTLCALLGRLQSWVAATGGAFDPAVGRLVEAWDLRGRGRRPHAAALALARRRSGMHRFVIDQRRCAVQRRADATLDAGAFGKGAALDRLRHAAPGTWLVDFGGQVAVSGERAWTVGVAHPLRRDAAAMEVRMTAGSLATSAGSERDLVLADGGRIGHILDPRTGRTVVRESLSVAVWHKSALAADILSTALYVMGPEAGLLWADTHEIAVCFLEARQEGTVARQASAAFRRQFQAQQERGAGGRDESRP